MNADEEHEGHPHNRPVPAPPRRRLPAPLAGLLGVVLLAGAVLLGGYASGWLRNDVVAPPPASVPMGATAPATASRPSVVDRFVFSAAPAPVADLNFFGGSGEPLSLSALQGRPILLNIWATWCVPCRQEMPALDRLQEILDPANVLVLALSAEDPARVERFYQEYGLRRLGIFTSRTGGETIKLGLPGIPGTLLIDAHGREIGRVPGPLEWDRPEVIDLIAQKFGLSLPARPASGEP